MSIQIRDLKGDDRTWPFASTNATVKKLEEAFRLSLGASGRLSDHRASLAASKRYTEQGVAAEAHRFAKNELLPAIARGHAALSQAKRQVKDRYSQLKPKAADKTDLVSFLKRDSIRRDSLLALSREQRDTLLSRHASELDPEVLLAALEHVDLPWERESFISEQTRTTLTRQLLSAEHGAALAEVEQIEEAIRYAQPTIDKARSEIQATLGLNDLQFKEAAQAEASRQPKVWLKKIGNDVKVLTPESETANTSTARPATQADIENGIFCDNIVEFRAALATAA